MRGNRLRLAGAIGFATLGLLPATASAGQFPSLSSGRMHSCAVNSDSNVRCWGDDNLRESTVPAELGTATRVDLGVFTSCAVKTNGLLACWGYDANGQATPPADLGRVVQAAPAFYHSCALKVGGTVACWGYNGEGETNVPVSLGVATQIDAGQFHTCAVKISGSAACWGANIDNDTVVPADLGPVKQISAGSAHTCAVKLSGGVACWGFDGDGQSAVPNDLPPVAQVSAGNTHTCAVTVAGTAVCWGDSGTSYSTVPADLGKVVHIEAGEVHTCAVKETGRIACWGIDANGQSTPPADQFPSLSGAMIDFGDSSGLDFGDVFGGSRSAVLRSVITASPSAPGVPLKISSSSLTATPSWVFSIESQTCDATVLADGASCTVRIRFTPAIWDRGELVGTLTVNDDSAVGTHAIRLVGTAVAPPAPVIQKVIATPNAGATDFAWQTSDDAKATVTIAQPVTSVVTVVKRGKKTKKKVTSIKQVVIGKALDSPAGTKTWTWDRKVGKVAAAKGTWAFVVTAKTARGTVTSSGTVTLG